LRTLHGRNGYSLDSLYFRQFAMISAAASSGVLPFVEISVTRRFGSGMSLACSASTGSSDSPGIKSHTSGRPSPASGRSKYSIRRTLSFFVPQALKNEAKRWQVLQRRKLSHRRFPRPTRADPSSPTISISRGPRPWERRVMNKPHRVVFSGAIPSPHGDGSFARSPGSRCL
jgi:hypothetical protein